ncbi:hypothetical protein TCON_1525 [Astathelohania contejeani]|uniref:Uncharacterized protein n=1 Tax=Astathelohania contejeani TaxID=164912 RepID=A0ABQ7HYK1_9MICR|nr:hypothetical protein TCON_1525 [Thelohania contejeani]
MSDSIILSGDSTVILDIPFSLDSETTEKNQKYLEDITTTSTKTETNLKSLDPLFYPFTIRFPILLKSFINVEFDILHHTLHSLESIEISTQDFTINMQVIEYPDIFKEGTYTTPITFVINRKKFLNKQRQKKNKSQLGKDIQKKYLYEYQIIKQINFIFIENSEDLLREIKTILKFYINEHVYIPKIKKTNEPYDHCQTVIQTIPGIGKKVGEAISNKFGCIGNLMKIINSRECEDLKEIMIQNDDKSSYRKLGDKQYKIIRDVFMNKNGEKILK